MISWLCVRVCVYASVLNIKKILETDLKIKRQILLRNSEHVLRHVSQRKTQIAHAGCSIRSPHTFRMLEVLLLARDVVGVGREGKTRATHLVLSARATGRHFPFPVAERVCNLPLSSLFLSRPFDPSRIRDREEDICRLIHPVCIVFYLQLLLVYDHRSSINPCSDMFMQWITRLISTSRTRRQVERRRGPRKVSFYDFPNFVLMNVCF